MIRILGLDIGSVRIGVALSDPLGMTAQPLEVIQRRQKNAVERILELIAEHDVTQLVVGYPLRLDGTMGPATESIDTFIRELEAKTSVPVERWDERLTTAQAERAMIQGGVRREKRRQSIDRIAAALILQSFLDARAP